MVHRFESSIVTSSMKSVTITIGQQIEVSCFIEVLGGGGMVILSELFMGNATLWTAAIESAGYKCLL